MVHFTKKQCVLGMSCGVLLVVLALCAWMFGWGGGSIHVMDLSASEVERIELYTTDLSFIHSRPVVTSPDEIQAVIDSVNSFQHTGNDLKDIFKYGLFAGGTVLYEFDVYLRNGELFQFVFGSNGGDQDPSNMEVSYWIYQPDDKDWFAKTCRGSMELFYNLFEKYQEPIRK